MSESSPIPTSIAKNLLDKLPDRRKQGATDLELHIEGMVASHDRDGIQSVILALKSQFVSSVVANARKGGLVGLSGVALGLGEEVRSYVSEILPPVISLFNDQDPKVRFHAAEAAYNILKASRGHMLPFLSDIFQSLSRVSGDADSSVVEMAGVLDRLLKDVVTESDAVVYRKLLGDIRDLISSTRAEVRQFLVGWIKTLNSIPGMNILDFIPHIVSGLLGMLNERTPTLRDEVSTLLGEFIRDSKRLPESDIGPVVKILLDSCASKDDDAVIYSLKWILELLTDGKDNKMMLFSAAVLRAIIPLMSHREENIRVLAGKTNDEVRSRFRGSTLAALTSQISSILETVMAELVRQSLMSRVATLQWLHSLLQKSREDVLRFIGDLFPLLLRVLSDPAEDVVSLDLEVLAQICGSDESIFEKFLSSLVVTMNSDRRMLTKCGLIVRQLSLLLGAGKVFHGISEILGNEKDSEFAGVMVQTLNVILLTSAELIDLRALIRHAGESDRGREIFLALYKSWCMSPTALLTLCLLAQAYELSAGVVERIAEFEVTVPLLVEIDRLVQLLESPIFAYLRVQLLEPHRHPFLLKTMFGLLMLLPQSSAFDLLSARLRPVSTLCLTQLASRDAHVEHPTAVWPANTSELLDGFVAVQKKRNAASGKPVSSVWPAKE